MSNDIDEVILSNKRWPHSVIDRVREPKRGTKFDDIELDDWVFQIRHDELHPSDIQHCEFPIQWPFTEAVTDYRSEDEYAIRFINTLPIAIAIIRQVSQSSESVVERGANGIVQRINGRTELMDEKRAIAARQMLSSLLDDLGDVQVALESLSTHVDTEAAEEVTEWVTRVRARTLEIETAFDVAYSYDGPEKGRASEYEVVGVMAKQKYADKLVDRYDEYIDEIYSLEFEEVVEEIYATTEKVTVEL